MSFHFRCEMKVVEKPELTEKLGDIKATLGEPIKVEVAAKSAPQFKWMINGQTLQVDCYSDILLRSKRWRQDSKKEKENWRGRIATVICSSRKISNKAKRES